MCAGTTSQRLKTSVTIGPSMYRRLEDMTEDKMKYRGNTGPVNLLTQQLGKDENSLGGLKLERWNGIACSDTGRQQPYGKHISSSATLIRWTYVKNLDGQQ